MAQPAGHIRPPQKRGTGQKRTGGQQKEKVDPYGRNEFFEKFIGKEKVMLAYPEMHHRKIMLAECNVVQSAIIS